MSPPTREGRPRREAPDSDPAAEQQPESGIRLPHPDTRLPLFLPRRPDEAARVLAIALGGKVQAHRWAKALLEALS
jgi:hypothetical protein